MKVQRSLLLSLAIAFAGSLAVVSGSFGYAQGIHGDGHNELHHWYESLRDKRGKSCCNMRDCRPTQSRFDGTNVEVMVDGTWAVVPPEKILSVPSPDFNSHVCSPKRPNSFPIGYVVCVVLGPGT